MFVQRWLSTSAVVLNHDLSGGEESLHEAREKRAADRKEQDVGRGHGFQRRFDGSSETRDHNGKFAARDQDDARTPTRALVYVSKFRRPITRGDLGQCCNNREGAGNRKNTRESGGIDFQPEEEK